jgi:hypothetical protein
MSPPSLMVAGAVHQGTPMTYTWLGVVRLTCHLAKMNPWQRD